MVALRGKKTNATTKPKAVEKANAAAAAAAAGTASNSSAAIQTQTGKATTTAQQILQQQRQEEEKSIVQRRQQELLQLLQFTLRSGLSLQKIPKEYTISSFCNTLLTAFAASSKERNVAPQQLISKLTRNSRKRVCGAIFTADEIAYSCRNCQIDSTCVTCKDCFTHSDHTGHDVYFQRTTAGSSCDCGDPHAWKQSGFCTKHPGIDSSVDNASKKQKLPKSISVVAPVVIDAVVEHLYQVLLGVRYGFELAEALELFTRNIPPHFLPFIPHYGKEDETATASVESSESDPQMASNNVSETRVLRGNRTGRSSGAKDSKVQVAKESPVLFGIRLHHDDVHSVNDTINHLCVALDFSKSSARTVLNETDRVGDSVITKRALLKCSLVVGDLMRRSLNMSLAPTWWDQQMQDLPGILEWLHFVSTSSDALADFVAEALSKERSPKLKGFDSLSGRIAKGTKINTFLKDHVVRLHSKASELITMLIGEDQDVFSWAMEQESIQKSMYRFHAQDSESTLSSSLPFIIKGEKVSCQNLFIEEFMKAVSQSHEFSRHESVRDGLEAVVAKFFTTTAEIEKMKSQNFSSVLTLMVQYDCVLHKRTAELSHALLREHLLDTNFRTSMLEAYVRSYRSMNVSFLQGLGNSSDSIFDFAVQFLTVPHLVKNYTRETAKDHPERLQLVTELLASLELVFKSAIDAKDGLLNVDHPAVSNQKYKHCVDNLEYVFNIGGIPNELVCDQENLRLWLSCLKMLQGGDLQVRRGVHQSHVEYESDSWLSMFNLGIRIHSIFPVSWHGFEPSVLEVRKLNLADIFGVIVDAVVKTSTHLNEKIAKKTLIPVTRLIDWNTFGTIDEQKRIVTYNFNVAAQPTSLHIPLHRFLAASLRHICIHQTGFGELIASRGFLGVFGLNNLPLESCIELIEMPLRNLVMASQIHSNLWRRNGDENMLAQLYNYSALPYCIHYRDSDTFMLQLGVLMMGPDDIIARMIDQYQLAEYFVQTNTDEQTKHVPISETVSGMGYTSLEVGIDEAQLLQMLEEFLRLVIVIGTSLPSSTGATYEDEFLAEEMLQQLCAKSYTFSKLFDLAILPSGQDDISIPRLEGVLAKVSEFVPPSGLEPGRYELKEGYLEKYNPYFLHLNRESHELARDRWTTYRKMCIQKRDKYSPPTVPLQPARTPVSFLRPVQDILMCQSTITIIKVILWKVLGAEKLAQPSTTKSANPVSDAVISTCLHLLVHGVHTACSSSNDQFWERLCSVDVILGNSSILSLLSNLKKKATSLLDEEQQGTLEWLIWKISASSSVCQDAFNRVEAEANARKSKAKASPTHTLTLEQRKEEARKRALATMAKQQASFQAMMSNMGDEEDENGDISESKADTFPESEIIDESMQLGKRRVSIQDTYDDLKKRQKRIDEETCHKCILCHDTSNQGQMGMAAYVHQSTVLASVFRPNPSEALGPDGKTVRKQVKELIEKMELCSGGPNSSGGMSPSPHVRGFSAPLSDWYLDSRVDAQPQTSPNAQRRHRQDRLRFGGEQFPILEGELLQTDEELEVLESIIDIREEDRHLFPLDLQAAVNLELDREREEERFFRRHRNHRHAHTQDSDDEEFTPAFHLERQPPGFSNANHESAKLFLTPCGLHIRTCQHAVHIQCLERYISSLHNKAMRGEEFDGVQAIDPDSAMTQFLCPLCKTLCNFLLPTSDPAESDSGENPDLSVHNKLTILPSMSSGTWNSIIEEQLQFPGWYRTVLGCDGNFSDADTDNVHDLWRDYFEDTLWEPHGSLEKGAPFLWSACAFSIVSFLTVAEDEYRNASGSCMPFDPIKDRCPPLLEKEFESLSAVTKFCRWSFSLLEHSADAKVILETTKRCCPINTETKREYRKFTKVLGSIDACLRGTILGLLVADTFTAFVASSVIAQDPSIIWRFIPVFSAADVLQRLYTEFICQKKTDEASLFQDRFSMQSIQDERGISTEATKEELSRFGARRTRSGRAIGGNSGSSAAVCPSNTEAADTVLQAMMESMTSSGEEHSDEFAALELLKRMLASDSSEKLKPLSRKELSLRLDRVKQGNTLLVRRMKLFWRCLTNGDPAAAELRDMHIPSISDIANSSDAVLDQIWKWCVDRMNSKQFLGIAKSGDRCEHTEGCSEAYVASMFILRDLTTKPQLIDLPVQYDELYSQMTGRKCDRCGRIPCDPGICLICGEYLCCGDSCCTRPFVPHGPRVGECTRHAAECGGGVGIVLLLDQCRVAIIGGSMAAYFPCPYVDAHGEEDVGLQRGRPLRLDMTRFRYLESLWVNHRIFTEVSRQRNQREPQYTINLSYL